MSKKEILEQKLNAEEQALLESIENDEWVTVNNVDEQKLLAKEVATSHFKKDMRINIRLSSHDLINIKKKAAYEGLPYQTLISSLLHKYAAGHL